MDFLLFLCSLWINNFYTDFYHHPPSAIFKLPMFFFSLKHCLLCHFNWVNVLLMFTMRCPLLFFCCCRCSFFFFFNIPWPPDAGSVARKLCTEPMHDAWTWRVWMSLYRPAHPATWVQRDGSGRSVRCVAVEPGEDRPIFRKRGEGVSSWSGALCYCLVPHIPSLTDRSEGATGTSTSWGGWGGCSPPLNNSVPLYRWFLVVGVVLPESGSWERNKRVRCHYRNSLRLWWRTKLRWRAGSKQQLGQRYRKVGTVLAVMLLQEEDIDRKPLNMLDVN